METLTTLRQSIKWQGVIFLLAACLGPEIQIIAFLVMTIIPDLIQASISALSTQSSAFHFHSKHKLPKHNLQCFTMSQTAIAKHVK